MRKCLASTSSETRSRISWPQLSAFYITPVPCNKQPADQRKVRNVVQTHPRLSYEFRCSENYSWITLQHQGYSQWRPHLGNQVSSVARSGWPQSTAGHPFLIGSLPETIKMFFEEFENPAQPCCCDLGSSSPGTSSRPQLWAELLSLALPSKLLQNFWIAIVFWYPVSFLFS